MKTLADIIEFNIAERIIMDIDFFERKAGRGRALRFELAGGRYALINPGIDDGSSAMEESG